MYKLWFFTQMIMADNEFNSYSFTGRIYFSLKTTISEKTINQYFEG